MFAIARFARTLTVLTVVVVAVGWFASQALTASNTVPASKAGEGAGTASGYTVSNLVYTLNGTNPQNIDQVDFDLDTTPPVGATMKLRLVSSGSDWYTCTNVAAAMTCVTTAPQATVVTADETRVVVAQ